MYQEFLLSDPTHVDANVDYYIEWLVDRITDQRGVIENLQNRIVELEIQLSGKTGELEAERRWIPVTERLPEGEYLDTSERYIVVVQYALPGYNPWIGMAGRLHGKWILPDNEDWDDSISNYVTHWRNSPLLPELP
jgi:hypothetical protein